jgi:hypothetical protein
VCYVPVSVRCWTRAFDWTLVCARFVARCGHGVGKRCGVGVYIYTRLRLRLRLRLHQRQRQRPRFVFVCLGVCIDMCMFVCMLDVCACARLNDGWRGADHMHGCWCGVPNH